MASRDTLRSVSYKSLPENLQVLTNSPVVVTTKDCYIFQLFFNNKTAGAITVTVTDGQSSPLDLLTAVSIAANSASLVVFPEGQKMPGGFSWSASANTSINASVVGFISGT